MDFYEFLQLFLKNAEKVLEGQQILFDTSVSGDLLWALYLESFAAEDNPIYRERRIHDCSACRHFIQRYGGIVVLGRDCERMSLWDFSPTGYPYLGQFAPSVEQLCSAVDAAPIKGLLVQDTETHIFGTASNPEFDPDTHEARVWTHLHLPVPKTVVQITSPSINAAACTARGVLERMMDEWTTDALNTVQELIEDNNLYRGAENRHVLETFEDQHRIYHGLKMSSAASDSTPGYYLWHLAAEYTMRGLTPPRSTSFGALITDLSTGVPMDEAVRAYEKKTAPENYQRPKGVFTKTQVARAEKFVRENNLEDSLPRRFARIDDVPINVIDYYNTDTCRVDTDRNVFSSLRDKAAPSKTVLPYRDGPPTVSIRDFLGRELPNSEHVEILFDSQHQNNLVSLIAPAKNGSRDLFHWGNSFSWAYAGNLADSSMKQRVKAFGGKVDGEVRFSIQWNEDGKNRNDLDAHCVEPSGGWHIYFQNKGMTSPFGGRLDVDIIDPYDTKGEDKTAVENITYDSLRDMHPGEYEFFVHNYSDRDGRGGVRAEFEINGKCLYFDFKGAHPNKHVVEIVRLTVHKDRTITITPLLSPVPAPQVECWGLTSGNFYPVSIICPSPNFWTGSANRGSRHLFFGIPGCTNPDTPNGFFNEYLAPEFKEHRQVFEILGREMRVKPDENQFSGLGFCLTRKTNFICKLTKNEVNKLVKVEV